MSGKHSTPHAADGEVLLQGSVAQWVVEGTQFIGRDSRLPKQLAGVRRMPVKSAFIEATLIVRRSRIEHTVLWWERQRTGPKRRVPMRAMLIICVAYIVQDTKRDLLFSELIEWLRDDVPETLRNDLGLHPLWKYDSFLATFNAFVDLIDDEDSVLRVTANGVIRERPSQLPSRDAIVNALVAASIPDACHATPVAAIDSTDLETPAKVQAMTGEFDGDDEHRPDDDTVKRWGTNKDKLLRGPDNRYILSADPQARCGYRTVVNMNRGTTFIGWDVHVLVDAGWVGADFYVQFIRGISVRAAGSHKGDAGIALLDSIDPRFWPDTLCADRGYSYARAERWVRPLLDRGIDWVHDLHKQQKPERRLLHHPKFSRHRIIDGTIFTDALPERFWALPAFRMGMTWQEKEELINQYEERAKWAFRPNGGPRPDGKWQYRGPAYLGHIDCINSSPHRKKRAGAPITVCAPGCSCDDTPLIAPKDHLNIRQKHLYGTRAWASHYGLRNASESKMADLKRNHGSMRRGSSLVFGTTANAFLMALRCAAVNVALRRSAYGDTVNLTTTDPAHVPTRRLRDRSGHAGRHLRNGAKTRPTPRRQKAARARAAAAMATTDALLRRPLRD